MKCNTKFGSLDISKNLENCYKQDSWVKCLIETRKIGQRYSVDTMCMVALAQVILGMVFMSFTVQRPLNGELGMNPKIPHEDVVVSE